MRKNIAFSNKNSDIFKVLSEMQEEGKNISDYICDLVRRDLEPQKTEVACEDMDFLKTKLADIETILKDIKDNKLVVTANEGTKEDKEEEPQHEYFEANKKPAESLGLLGGLI